MRNLSSLTALVAMVGMSPLAYAGNDRDDHRHRPRQDPLVLEKFETFAFGGKVITGADGNTARVDSGYAQAMIPPKAEGKANIIMWHGGAGQFGKTYETTPDGREGFQTIFARKGFPTYVIDQPGRGRATKSTIGQTIPNAVPDDANWWNVFRLGVWNPPNPPQFFPNVAFPRDAKSLDQYFRQDTPQTGPEGYGGTPEADEGVRLGVEAVSALADKIGPSVLITHSGSTGPGWFVAMRNKNIKAIINFEGPVLHYPAGVPLNGTPGTNVTPLAEWLRLTKIPIILVGGDNLDISAAPLWPPYKANAQRWVDFVNSKGGNARYVDLPALGIRGNTHFPFSDLNNKEVAEVVHAFLKKHKLDKLGGNSKHGS